MRLHRFIGNYDFSNKNIGISHEETVKQIRNVLKMDEGEVIELGDGKGKVASVKITKIEKGQIECEVLEVLEAESTKRKVTLYLAILKKENFELAVQKAVECGVTEIIPVITERTIKTGLNTERLEKIIKEASEQCGQSIVPALSPIINFNDALIRANSSNEKIIFHIGGENYKPTKSGGNSSPLVSIFIGPEGGFTDKEIDLATNTGYTVASLGNLVLRGETAGIIATYRAVHGI